ncbi:MAG TPA: helix-turn-helix transcriptional regulator [Gemmatimonadales bacterium]|nr:helix-turn-helix transcriptional regulator [Gemmatimonadales bacterium]
MTTTEANFGQRLRRLRAREALSQRELAELAGTNVTTIVRLESGEFQPRPSTIRKLARALGVKPAVFVGETG